MGNMRYASVNGFQTSEADVNILLGLRPPNATAPQVKTFSMYVESDTFIIINDGEEVFVSQKLGLNYTDEFLPVKSLKFKESGINYFMAYGI